jgi:lysophospholipase L1-like esterase
MTLDLIRPSYNRAVPQEPLLRRVVRLLVVTVLVSWPAAAPAQTTDPDPARFAAEMRAFAEADAKTPAPSSAVLFVGSSTIRLWPTAVRFPDLPVINRGFGGSHISDVNHYLDVTVLKYAPDVVVFYAGDNDIAAGKTPQRVLADYQRFVDRVLAAKPETEIIFVAIKPSPSRWALWPAMREANALIRTYSGSRPRLHYADVVPATLGADGQPRPELFLADRLHLNPAGYDQWTPVVAEVIAAARRPRSAP